MIYNEIMQNLNEIIGNNRISENVYNVFKTTEKLINNNEVIFKIDPNIKTILNGMGFTKNKNGVFLLVGQYYLDTFNKNSSIHYTILIHELKHLYDYSVNKDTFFNSTEKEKYFYEFEAKIIEAEFIKYYLMGKYDITKCEKLLVDSFEKNNLDFYSILFQRVSKNIYLIFNELENEYKNNKITLDNIIRELVNGALQLFDEYSKSNDDFTKYVNFVKIKSFRNNFEDFPLINNQKLMDNFDEIPNDEYRYYLSNIYSQLYDIIDNYKKDNSNYLTNLQAYLENEYMK